MWIIEDHIVKAEKELQELRVAWKHTDDSLEKARIFERAKERTEWLEKLKRVKGKKVYETHL